MRGGGLALKSLQMFLRVIELCCAIVIFAIFVYFLVTLRDHDLHIDTYIRAVTGISGVGIVWTILCFLFVCCLGGVALLSFLGMLLDLAFCGAFIYVAWATRASDGTCNGNVNTPLGSGNTNTSNTLPDGNGGVIVLPSLHTACRLETVTFAVAIIGAVFFFLSIFVEYGLIRHHKKEKAFGPSPNNGYTTGSPRRKFWQRKPKRDAEYGMTGGLAGKQHPDLLPTHATPADYRTSYATDTTAVNHQQPYTATNGNF